MLKISFESPYKIEAHAFETGVAWFFSLSEQQCSILSGDEVIHS